MFIFIWKFQIKVYHFRSWFHMPGLLFFYLFPKKTEIQTQNNAHIPAVLKPSFLFELQHFWHRFCLRSDTRAVECCQSVQFGQSQIRERIYKKMFSFPLLSQK